MAPMNNTAVLQSSGRDWRHYFIVTPARAVIFVDMVPALLGWNVRKIESQGEEAWPLDMTAADIVAWKLQNHDVVRVTGADADAVIALVKSKGAL